MLNIKPGQTVPTSKHSRKMVAFICDCGREKKLQWKNYTTNHPRSCGFCKSDKYQLSNIAEQQFGLLRLASSQQFPKKIQKRTKLLWQCTCGNSIVCAVGSVVDSLTKSCGCLRQQKTGRQYRKPKQLSKEHWLAQIPALIDKDLPPTWSVGSGFVCWFRCECGNIYQRRFFKWTPRSTCQKCHKFHLIKNSGKRFGNLVLVDERNIELHYGSEQKVKFKCDCGNTKMIKLGAVTRGFTTTCNECNTKAPGWWMAKKFGNLTPIEVKGPTKLYSEQPLMVRCACGNISRARAADLARGHKKTCGLCYQRGYEWWASKDSPIYAGTKSIPDKYSLTYLRNYFDESYLLPLGGADTANEYIRFRCLLCGTEFQTKLSWVWHSKIVSCGCLHHSSKSNLEIGTWLESVGYEVLYGNSEQRIEAYQLDAYVPTHNLAVEHHGLRYHCGDADKQRQLAKARACASHNINLIVIYEDEWLTKQSIFKDLILSRLGGVEPTHKLRPQQCDIDLVTNSEIAPFYEDFHYLGPCSCTHNIAVKSGGEVVAALSLKHPSRQASGDWEIARMACNHDYRIYGVWSYLLRWLQRTQLIDGELITFSDNRLSNGNVYQAMGMKLVGDVRPDYYWVKGGRRFHKSALRKKKHEKELAKTETELRHAQGYTKIWDLGKRKWVWTF